MDEPNLRPVCECGAELYLIEETKHWIVRGITDKGFANVRVNKTLHESVEILKCTECHTEFVTQKDDTGRLHRGERFLPF